MQEPSALGRIVELVRELRRRCPWDARQTPTSLRPYLVEEVLELDHALASGDPEEIEVELGDLLLHLAFQIVLGEEAGHFGPEDVTRVIEEKMWRRHPHLFPDRTAGGRGQAHPESRQGPEQLGRGEKREDTWERTKLREHAAGSRSALDGLPPRLPALLEAHRLQERAAGVGFDWPDAEGPLAKVKEEIGELEREISADGVNRNRIEQEIGDILFAMVNLARRLEVDPRPALESANARFAERFRRVETLAAERGIDVGRADLATLDKLWDEVKERQWRDGKREM
ncbi:MAG: nucleoside triphosphate pyrophosphohydrolase [Gemmatimonadales bacterium]